jgi:hypothetical protein
MEWDDLVMGGTVDIEESAGWEERTEEIGTEGSMVSGEAWKGSNVF